MSPDIKIFVSCHEDGVFVPKHRMLYPLQVGTAFAQKPFKGMYHDNEGDNISAKNRSYCELTGQYWAWKNARADYYGFFHYRRYLSFAQKRYPIVHEPFVFGEVVRDSNAPAQLEGIGCTAQRMREVITAHDFIVPEPVSDLDGNTVYEQYLSSIGHHIEDLDVVLDIIKRRYPQFEHAAQNYMNRRELYCRNMFVMRKELFSEYSQWLFDILDEFEQARDISGYLPVEMRVCGYLAERLCGVYATYLFEQGYDGLELQSVYFRDVSKPRLFGKR